MKKPIVLILPLLIAPFLSACEPKVYTVIFDVDGGSAINNQEVQEKQKVTKPSDPTKTGYDFVNWTYGEQAWNFGEDQVKEDITLKANYVLHDYKVTFKNVDGTVLQVIDNAHYADKVTYTGAEPVYPNPEAKCTYTFEGWDKPLEVFEDIETTAVFGIRDKSYHVKYMDPEKNFTYELYTDEVSEIPTECPEYTPLEGEHNDISYRFLGWEKQEIKAGETFYTAKYDRCSKGLKFKRTAVTGYEGSADTIYIPEAWNGYTITSIEPETFKDQTQIKKVDIPGTVDDILNKVFENCTSLETVVFHEGLRYMEIGAFLNCSALKKITLPDSFLGLTRTTFEGCDALEYNEYQNGLYLGTASNPYFALVHVKDTTVETFVMHDDCVTISSGTFVQVPALRNVTISSKIERLGQFGFASNYELEFTVDGGAKYLGNPDNPYLILVKADTTITSVNIHAGCRIINEEAFKYCKQLAEVTFPSSLLQIGGMAFSGCTSLKSIDIPASVKSIEYVCFNGCSSLETVTLHDGLIYIEPSAFGSCSALKKIDIPNSVIYIGSGAFMSCYALETVTLPNKITMIDQNVFSSCRALKSIYIPNNVLSIERQAFGNCRELTDIRIPKSVEYIGDRVLSSCQKLATITYAGNEEEWNAIEKDATWAQGSTNYAMRYNDGGIIE